MAPVSGTRGSLVHPSQHSGSSQFSFPLGDLARSRPSIDDEIVCPRKRFCTYARDGLQGPHGADKQRWTQAPAECIARCLTCAARVIVGENEYRADLCRRYCDKVNPRFLAACTNARFSSWRNPHLKKTVHERLKSHRQSPSLARSSITLKGSRQDKRQ